MSLMISYGKELIRINLERNTIEFSVNSGRNWNTRFIGNNAGKFVDLVAYGNEILACTSKGIFYSTNSGRTWNSRYTASTCGDFIQLNIEGKNLLATTSRGLFYSVNDGRTWNKRY